MKALTALACLVAVAASCDPAQAKVSQGYWTIIGPRVSGNHEAWAVCRSLVAQVSPVYRLYRVTILSTGKAKCWYSTT